MFLSDCNGCHKICLCVIVSAKDRGGQRESDSRKNLVRKWTDSEVKIVVEDGGQGCDSSVMMTVFALMSIVFGRICNITERGFDVFSGFAAVT